MLRPRFHVTSLTLTFAAVLLAASSRAQDGDPKPPAADPAPAVAEDQAEPSPPKTFTPYRRVPSNFGKVGLSSQQKEDIYILRGRYQTEIAELKARIEELSRKEMGECESVLTEAQRKLLDQLRAATRPGPLGTSGSGN